MTGLGEFLIALGMLGLLIAPVERTLSHRFWPEESVPIEQVASTSASMFGIRDRDASIPATMSDDDDLMRGIRRVAAIYDDSAAALPFHQEKVP